MGKIIFLLLILNPFILSITYKTENRTHKFAYKNEETGEIYIADTGDEKDCLASGNYTNSYEQKGWDILTVSSYMGTDKKYSDLDKAYAMGLLEGDLSHKQIYNFYQNMLGHYFYETDEKMPEDTRKYFEENFAFYKEKIEQNKIFKDPYWTHAELILKQLDGLVDGYNMHQTEENKIDLVSFQVMNAFGDLDDIPHYYKYNRPIIEEMTDQELFDYIALRSHCSSLMKMAPDFSELWIGHNTWFSYNHIYKVFKEYRFSSNDNTEKSKVISLTSYPGVLSSNDDFYITEQELYVSETTNSVFNMDVYDNMSPRSVLTWLRVLICNRLATSAEEWIDMFMRHNSGTYNNQYKIVDMKKIHLDNKTLENNAFMIVEQLPGMFRVHDMTKVLKRGYWPSFNSPFDEEIQKESGYPENFESRPDTIPKMHYFMGSRPSIFRRDQNKVNSNEAYMDIITKNNYTGDPFCQNNPSLAIAARYDLVDDPNPKCHGLISAEFIVLTELKGKKNKKFHLITGPTHNGVPPYTWETSKCKHQPGTKHLGQVEKFEFDWFEQDTILFDY